ncbi:MAG: MFS transporter [Firmicutes bacterium]|nr:MFS transporter [Bacillota bacterium]
MSYLGQFRGLPRQVYILCLIRWITGMGSLVFTFSSLILTGMVGLSTSQAGTVAMFYAAANVVGAIVGGKAADFFGRKRIYFWFTLVTCCFYVLGSFYCTTIWIVPISLCAFFFGSGCYPIVSAMVADSAKGPKSAECFSLLYLCHNLGFAVGPALGGALLADHLDWVYRIQAGMFLLGAVILYLCTEEVYKVPTKEERMAAKAKKNAEHFSLDEPESELHVGTLQMLLRTKILLIFIVTLAIATTLYCAIGFILPLQFKDSFGLAAGGLYGGRIWTVNALMVVFGTPVIMKYTKSHHQFNCMALGCLLYSIGFGAYGYIKALPLYFVSVVIWSIGEILISTGAGVFIAEHSPASHVARFQSQYDMARSVGRGLGPFLFGQMLSVLNYRQTWTIDAAACIIIAAYCWHIYKQEMAKKAREEKI